MAKRLGLIVLAFFVFNLFIIESASAIDAVLPVRGFAHEVEIRSGCTAYTDVATLNSDVCHFESTNLGWTRFDIKDVNVTSGWYYQFYFNMWVSSTTAVAPTIQTQPLLSITDAFDVVAFNQVETSEYVGAYSIQGAQAGYSYTYSIIVRANETTQNASIRLSGAVGNGQIFRHLDSGGNVIYPNLYVNISRLHAFELIDYSSQLDDIIAAIEDLSSSSSSASMKEALDDHDDDQQEKYEDQAEENEDAINDDSSAAQSTATTLLNVFGQFVTTLTNAQPTNCNLNGNLIPHLPLGNLDLCQNSPPAAITALGSLLLIAFVVPLAYHTVKRMLALIGSFQS